MSGIALIIKGADYSSKGLGTVTPFQSVDITGLSIDCESSYTGMIVPLKVAYQPSYTSQKGVTWSLTGGSEYASVNRTTGVLTIKSGASDSTVSVRATSVYNQEIYADASFTVTYDETPVYATGLRISLGTPSNNKIQASVSYIPASTNQYGVTWAITEGGSYATVDSSTGVIYIEEDANSSEIEVTATYTHDGSVVASVSTLVTYTEIVLPTELQEYWDAFKASAQEQSFSFDDQYWFYGSESKSKVAFFEHYERMGNSVPVGDIMLHGNSATLINKEGGTVIKSTYTYPNKIHYDSELGIVIANPEIYTVSGTRDYTKMLVVSNYETPVDISSELSKNAIASKMFGSNSLGLILLSPQQLDIVISPSTNGGWHLPYSTVTGTDTLRFNELYMEFDLENQGNINYIKKLKIDGVDYKGSLVQGVSRYSSQQAQRVRPIHCDMIVLIAK